MSIRKAFAFEYDQHDLANGLRLITVPTPFPHIVSLQIVVHAGSRNEIEEGRSGFAHFFEHMMFRGTPEFPPERYEAVLQSAGAASNANTDDDRTIYHTTMTKADFESILAMEADRFRNLRYPEEDFRTEALAVYGEYNKDSAEPLNKLYEVLRDTAFDEHTYKHTTMGFLRDIERMPQMFDYSLQFFDRFYRPEYTTLIVAGDVHPVTVRQQVEKHWGEWQPGRYRFSVPVEPPQQAAREAHIPWATPTLPLLLIAHKTPAYDDASLDWASLDLISFIGFSEVSTIFEKHVIEEQTCDTIYSSNADHVDPYLFSVLARLKEPEKLNEVRNDILNILHSFASTPVSQEKLDAARSRLRYGFAMALNSSEAIAESLAHYVSLRRTPETINHLYATYDKVTPEHILQTAQRTFKDQARTTITLTHEEGGAK